MKRAVAAAFLVCLFTAAPAAAGGWAQVVSPSGKLIAQATGDRFDYPADGSLVHVGRARVTPSGVSLSDVSLLGGRIQTPSVELPRGGRPTAVGDLAVDGLLRRTDPNTLVPLTGGGYVMVAQEAVTREGNVGRVGLRLVLDKGGYGVDPGTQVLVGLPTAPRAARPARAAKPARPRRVSPLSVLGFTNAPLDVPEFVPAPAVIGGTLGSKAVTIALRYLGIPYVWAGASPDVGFDCSGLVMYVYGQLGISLGHYTGFQIHQGTPVSREELQPGDIVFFFASGGVPGHEGMYIGGNQFIHAPRRGDVVKISSLDDPHYALGYVGAVRPYAG